jgi:hypothetical protein
VRRNGHDPFHPPAPARTRAASPAPEARATPPPSPPSLSPRRNSPPLRDRVARAVAQLGFDEGEVARLFLPFYGGGGGVGHGALSEDTEIFADEAMAVLTDDLRLRVESVHTTTTTTTIHSTRS